jgi:hypothetical protein
MPQVFLPSLAWRLRIWLGEHSSNTIPAMENFSLDALVDGGIKLSLDGDIDQSL